MLAAEHLTCDDESQGPGGFPRRRSWEHRPILLQSETLGVVRDAVHPGEHRKVAFRLLRDHEAVYGRDVKWCASTPSRKGPGSMARSPENG